VEQDDQQHGDRTQPLDLPVLDGGHRSTLQSRAGESGARGGS
jgi:hypothetical protein